MNLQEVVKPKLVATMMMPRHMIAIMYLGIINCWLSGVVLPAISSTAVSSTLRSKWPAFSQAGSLALQTVRVGMQCGGVQLESKIGEACIKILFSPY